ncbi:hypothetical protein GUF92_07310 [Xanthomonas citri pv. citri]|nr:hypothetical protein [Xanthomonas citri pv. citri]MBD4160040.1 hypothetical protein [Xanthomonas citri pv. citri]MBD4629938.1 hypothetical protein [Xanthomonas citri pv. citri]MBD4674617.1 hypothetical protein [Xanthomonas citri pv. citri]MBD4833540.1 hypothetical protein [Xanthomonas citri pv. citri]
MASAIAVSQVRPLQRHAFNMVDRVCGLPPDEVADREGFAGWRKTTKNRRMAGCLLRVETHGMPGFQWWAVQGSNL